MQLVDEEDDAAFGGFDDFEDLLETLLEVAAVLRARYQRRHVQRKDHAAAQQRRRVLFGDALGDALGDGGLANAGFADQDGIVLETAREDAETLVDLLVASQHRVHQAFAGFFQKVATEAVQLLHLLGADAKLVGRGQTGRQHRLDRFDGDAELGGDRRGRRLAIAQNGQIQVWRTHVGVERGSRDLAADQDDPVILPAVIQFADAGRSAAILQRFRQFSFV